MTVPRGYRRFAILVPCVGVLIVADVGARRVKRRAAMFGRRGGAPA